MDLSQNDGYTDVADVDKRILNCISEKPLTEEAVSAVLGIPKHQVKRRLRKLKKYREVEVSTVKKCFFWKRRNYGDGL